MAEKSSRNAVQFGAGNIGRGFIGQMLSQAGYRLCFVDVVEPLLELINQRGKYTIIEVDGSSRQEILIKDVQALDGKKEADVIQAITQADLVTTAVGPNILRVVAPGIAKGLQQRAELKLETPLNVIACENLIGNSTILRQYVFEHLPAEHQPYVERYVGFPDCVVDRVVTTPDEAQLARDPLSVIAEGQGQWIVDRTACVGELPAIEGMKLTDNLAAYVEQKIFTLNTAHAVTGYLGYLKGYQFIHEAVRDPEIRCIVLGVLWEFGAVLTKRHNLDPVAQQQYAAQTLKRFENSTIPDPVIRVGREPKRKLAPTDRLVRPATLALEAGVKPDHLVIGIAAALSFDAPDDPQALELAQEIETKGIEQILAEVSDLPADSILVELIKEKLPEVAQFRTRRSQGGS